MSFVFYRLDSLNVGWTSMSRGAVLYMVICLSSSLTKLNLSGCRETLLDEGMLTRPGTDAENNYGFHQ